MNPKINLKIDSSYSAEVGHLKVKTKLSKGFNMEDIYRIYVDQLRDGKTEQLERKFPAEILDCGEKDLSFHKEIDVTGEAYIAEDALVLHLDLHTEVTLPCSICNNPVAVPLSVEELYFVQPIEEIKSHIFDLRDCVRENILLEVPLFAECSGGQCPERKTIDKYLKNSEDIEEGFKPFSDLS